MCRSRGLWAGQKIITQCVAMSMAHLWHLCARLPSADMTWRWGLSTDKGRMVYRAD